MSNFSKDHLRILELISLGISDCECGTRRQVATAAALSRIRDLEQENTALKAELDQPDDENDPLAGVEFVKCGTFTESADRQARGPLFQLPLSEWREAKQRIALLETAIHTFIFGGNIREGEISVQGVTCKYSLESVEHLESALSGRGVDEEAHRWEIGFRNIVTTVLGARKEFDILDVVQAVERTHSECGELRSECAVLKEKLDQVDDVLIVNDISAKDGDYRKALGALVAWGIQIHDDPAVSPAAKQRQEQLTGLSAGLEEWRNACGAEVSKTDEIRTIVEPFTDERAKVVDMVRDAVAKLASGERPIPDGFYLYNECDKRIGWMDNCIVWWRPNGNGYTNNLNDAGVYSDEYRKKHKAHKELRFVPCSAVHAAAKTSTHVWIGDLERAMQESKKAKCQSQNSQK